jgi:dTDP-4-amino-4,6-dideoxygalactose transaminase
MPPMFERHWENVLSYELYPRAINLPTYHDVAEEEMDRVIGHVRKFFAQDRNRELFLNRQVGTV